jgi:hypothetical protein
MAAAVTGGLNTIVRGLRTPDSGFNTNLTDTAILQLIADFRESGTAANKVDLRFIKRYTFTASTAQTLDLTAAAGDDGVTSAFAKVCLVLVRVNGTADGSSLTIDNAGATNAFAGFLNSAGTLAILPSTSDGTNTVNNGGFFWVAPNTTAGTVDSTHKNVRLLPSAHAFTADVVILGRSA